MKKKLKIAGLVVVFALIGIVVSLRQNFQADSQVIQEIIYLSASESVPKVWEALSKQKGFTNPIVHLRYCYMKGSFYERFISQTEPRSSASQSQVLNSIIDIYHEYWRNEFLKENKSERTDTLLYQTLATFFLEEELTTLHPDTLVANIKNDGELTRIIKAEGAHVKFFFLNGIQDISIWETEDIGEYEVELPDSTINVKVVFISDYLMRSFKHYTSWGTSSNGGWAEKDNNTLFCDRSSYVLDEEEFMVSYLKHESIHFLDLNNYQSLSSTDLEYRAKLVELMYCTEKTIHACFEDFVRAASSDDRSYSHPYANYCIVKDFSKILFDSDYVTDFSRWKQLTPKQINDAAAILYKKSTDYLNKNPTAKEVI